MEEFANSYLVTAAQMRDFDSAAINQFGIPGVVLMENAGRSTFEILRALFEDRLDDLSVSVIAGPGNNGGDGYVIARYLINSGAEVQTFLLSPPEKIQGDARTNLNILQKMGAKIWQVDTVKGIESVEATWAGSEVIVDAILGTGLKSDVRSPYREVIEMINTLPSFKLSVDIPSGLDSDTGEIRGAAIHADLTVTYGFKKLGMAMYPGRILCGEVELVDISIPQVAVRRDPPSVVLYENPDLTNYLEIRSDPTAHKGMFGRTLIVGGSTGKTGAPAMAAMAASRIGAGLVTVAVPSSLNHILEIKLTEEMTEPVPDESGYFIPSAADCILELCRDKDIVAVGPGMSTNSGATAIIQNLLKNYDGNLIIDADGLNCLAKDLSFLSGTKAKVILTPHPGEMARLVGASCSEIQMSRFNVGRRFSDQYKCWVILKGAGTMTFCPDGKSFINTTGNSWMSSGGQGDALTGILAGLISQKLKLEEALPLGVWLHGFLADRLIERDGARVILATDILKEIPTFLTHIVKSGLQEEEEMEKCR